MSCREQPPSPVSACFKVTHVEGLKLLRGSGSLICVKAAVPGSVEGWFRNAKLLLDIFNVFCNKNSLSTCTKMKMQNHQVPSAVSGMLLGNSTGLEASLSSRRICFPRGQGNYFGCKDGPHNRVLRLHSPLQTLHTDSHWLHSPNHPLEKRRESCAQIASVACCDAALCSKRLLQTL